MKLTLYDFPPELLSRICSYCSKHLPRLALVSKGFNQIATQLLYKSITLDSTHATLRCCKTLANGPAGSNLARLVRSFAITVFYIGNGPPDSKFREDLCQSVRAMSNLHHFTCFEHGLLDPKLWIALATCGFLRSLSVRLPNLPEAGTLLSKALIPIRPQYPYLTSILLYNHGMYSLPEGLVKFLQNLLSSCAPQLKTLSFLSKSSNPNFPIVLLETVNDGFPELEQLVTTPASLSVSAILNAPSVHTLTLLEQNYGGNRDKNAQIYVPDEAFPRLRDLSCPHYALDAILNAHNTRAVRSLCLDEAFFDEIWTDYSSFGGQPRWEDVFNALRCIPNSKGPVTELSFRVGSMSFRSAGGLKDASPFLRSIEKLTICLAEDPFLSEDDVCLGDEFFSHLPNLHTFLLSDGIMHHDDSDLLFMHTHDTTLQKLLLDEWDKRFPESKLRKVALTLRVDWNKIDGKWTEGTWMKIPGEESESESDTEE